MWRLLVVFAFEKPNQAQRDRKRTQHAFENNAQNAVKHRNAAKGAQCAIT